jgi:anti-sigma B factor antagonist
MTSRVNLRAGDKPRSDLIRIELSSSVENETVIALAKQLDSEYEKGARRIIIDMSSVDFISSAGVGVIFSRTQKFRRTGGDIIIFGLADEIMYILKELDLVNYLTICKDIGEAESMLTG